MFKRSTNSQGDIFKNMSSHLSGRKQKMLDSPDGWHNVFYQEVVSQIDETLYSELYDQRMGRPNASVRVLIGMMILKEGQGWSDEQLFEECRFNLKIMRSLGLSNIDDDIPVESTYYEFRKLLGNYYAEHQRDLLKETFIKITTRQVHVHGVSGKKIRLDSKLINSNIVRSNRLHLILEAVRTYVSDLNMDDIQEHFDASSYDLLKSMHHKSTTNITYPLNAQQKRDMLIAMGQHIRTLLDLAKGSESKNYKLLERIYEEQYEQVCRENHEDQDEPGDAVNLSEDIEDMVPTAIGVILPKSPKDIPSSSVQSIHDPEAAYRTKGQGTSKQSVSGYHANITESCDPQEAVHLILDVDVACANVSEADFLIDAVKASQQIIEQVDDPEKRIEEVLSDGGYDSIENRQKMLDDEQNPTWSVAKLKGSHRVYQIEKNDEGELEVYDIKSGDRLEILYSEKTQKYVIRSEGKIKRYLTPKQIENHIQRQQIENQANEENHNLRATVESTIHQTFHLLKKNNKMVYRGLIKCRWYAVLRALWVNSVRIKDKNQKNLKNATIYLIFIIEHFVKAHKLNRHLNFHYPIYSCIYNVI